MRVPEKGLSREYQLKIPLNKRSEIWKTQIVMSTANPDRLPQSLGHDDVRRVCIVESTFETAGIRNLRHKKGAYAVFKLKNGRMWQRGHPYILATFNVRVLVGAADLKFQLESKDGQIFNKDHPEIEVTWEPVISSSSGSQNMGKMFRKQQ